MTHIETKTFCPCCGAECEVKGSDEGTHYYVPKGKGVFPLGNKPAKNDNTDDIIPERENVTPTEVVIVDAFENRFQFLLPAGRRRALEHLIQEALAAERRKVLDSPEVRGLVELLRETLKENEFRAAMIEAPEDAVIDKLCEEIGYGAVMDSAARNWQKNEDSDGAFICGPSLGTIKKALAAFEEFSK